MNPGAPSGQRRPTPRSAPSAIEIRGLTRRFGDLLAVDGVSFSVPVGSFFGFLGPNGAGKTTTLRMLTGLLAPTSGEAWIEGRSIVTDPVEVKRHIGVVPDDLALFDRLTLWEHLTLAGPLYGLTAEETALRAEALLRPLDLWEARSTFAHQASHGMRKKTALALALLHGPRVLFLDEPFEGIDPISGQGVRRLLQALAEKGVTIFLTSHILEVVERLVDRVAILAHGRIVRETSMTEIRSSGRSLGEVFEEAVGISPDRGFELPWLL